MLARIDRHTAELSPRRHIVLSQLRDTQAGRRGLRRRAFDLQQHTGASGQEACRHNPLHRTHPNFIARCIKSPIARPRSTAAHRETGMHDFTVRIEKAAIFRSLENLMTFPFVRERVQKGEMDLHGAYFGVAEGSLFVLDQQVKEFRSAREA